MVSIAPRVISRNRLAIVRGLGPVFLVGLFIFSEGVGLAPIGARHGEHFGRDLRIIGPARGHFGLDGLFAKILGWLDHDRASINLRAGDPEQLLRSRVSFKPLQSSVGGGKDGPGVRPTALGSFVVFRTKNMRASPQVIFATALVRDASRICYRHRPFRKRANLFRFSPSVVRTWCEAAITQKFGNGIGLK